MSLAVTGAKSVRIGILVWPDFAWDSDGQAPPRRGWVGLLLDNDLIGNVGLSLAYSALPMRTFL